MIFNEYYTYNLNSKSNIIYETWVTSEKYTSCSKTIQGTKIDVKQIRDRQALKLTILIMKIPDANYINDFFFFVEGFT